MMKHLFKFIFASLLLVVCSTAHVKAQSEIDSTTIITKGDKVPAFSFVDNEGNTHEISEYKGKTIMLVFFATWCGPCRAELKELNNEVLPPFMDDENFEIMIFGREHSQEEVSKFKYDNQYLMPFYADPDRSIFAKFATAYIPRCFIINAKGKVVFNSVGYSEDVKTEMQKTLKEQLN